ncbi:SulP family sulfate permease [Anaerosolibacter carboniphilus]|uniref:SulP family sulfate permease n=1 Tax=Anaerosolibacter carboniphilus TaxID=1417629 RepID=A0A841L098_9FIRM|nr:SulP family inorganic anion transporter [Anaerosolibacter carboniphilus]MBB6215815.1 SulP family sulfate permease [Anaerosolibacter carboniphilus]
MTKKNHVLAYDIKNLKGDILGGFTTAIVALPLALAFGVASGAGAKAGLYSAIITGILSTLFGGTPAQVNGPTGAMTVVLIELYEKFGLEALFASMLVAGIIQILIGVFRLGKYIHLIPQTVIIGFTNGIGFLIFIKMITYFQTNPVLASITILIMLLFPLLTKKIPASLVALIAGTLLGIHFLPTDALVGTIPSGLPTFAFPIFKVEALYQILRSGFVLAMLGCIESLLASLIVDEMTRTKHHSNRELIGQGIGNTVASLFGALIGTGAIVRSVVNVNAGGRTRLSGVLHGVVLLVITLKFGSLASIIPLAVLGGILMGTAIKMVEYNATRTIAYASKRAGTVVIATTLLTIFTDLTIAVAFGTLLSMFFFVLRMGEVYLKKYEIDCTGLTQKIASYTIEGPLFFGVAHTIISKLEIEAEDADIVVLNLMNMPAIDSSGAISLKNVKEVLKSNNTELVFAGLRENSTDLLLKMDVLTEEEVPLSTLRIGEVLDRVKGLAPNS